MPTVRTEFGFERTVCGCEGCIKNCQHLSGYLVPADLIRYLRKFGLSWCLNSLMASPGATLLTKEGMTKVPTLVPRRRRSNGACIFLNDTDHSCAIHEEAPFGCAFFGHESHAEADEKSLAGLIALREDGNDSVAIYQALWNYLWDSGARAEAPGDVRRRCWK